ncbi:MAG: DUF1800 domain-containing protein [Candidatus Obscuribacterales bacterium]|nr:DUF1800 domain-containing protein [Candidatus Obscuribacterales bacterium]
MRSFSPKVKLSVSVMVLCSMSFPAGYAAKGGSDKDGSADMSRKARRANSKAAKPDGGVSERLKYRDEGQKAATPPLNDEQKARHLLNRISFGPRNEDIDKVLSIGVDRYIDEQLEPQSIALPESIAKLSAEPALKDNPAQLFLSYGRDAFDEMAKAAKQQSMTGKIDAQVKKEIGQMVRDNYQELFGQVAGARLLRSVNSPRQLEEVMTDFWFNHFNVSMNKGLDHLWIGSYEEVAIRPHVLGKFRDLLGDTAHHAAMLFYLDNWQNTAPEKYKMRPGKIGKRFAGLNENYARELMELHTLGVDGGYSQKDVVELARVLTGHGIISKSSIQKYPAGLNSKYGFYFDSDRHDFSDKILLGHIIRGRGAEEVEEALDLLAKHPSTATYISYKLAQYFVADEPPKSLVDKLSKTFTASGGDIKATMKALLRSDDFWSSANSKYKSPYRYLISSLRVSNASIQNSRPLLGFLNQQGMPLYQCQTPDGYKNTEKAWLSSSGLLQRINFATAYGAGRLPAARATGVEPEQLIRVVGLKPTDTTAQVVETSPKGLKISLLLGSPEFMKY